MGVEKASKARRVSQTERHTVHVVADHVAGAVVVVYPRHIGGGVHHASAQSNAQSTGGEGGSQGRQSRVSPSNTCRARKQAGVDALAGLGGGGGEGEGVVGSVHSPGYCHRVAVQNRASGAAVANQVQHVSSCG